MTPDTADRIDIACREVSHAFHGKPEVPTDVYDRVADLRRAHKRDADAFERLDLLAAFIRSTVPAALAREPWMTRSRRDAWAYIARVAAAGLRETNAPAEVAA